MEPGRIIILTGAPGTGKTTVAALTAKESDRARSVHMRTDRFYHDLSKGAVPPHLPESNKQNQVVVEAILAAAQHFARNGYDVIVDGIIGPWFLEPWKRAARTGAEIHYLVLRASREETLRRALGRAKLNPSANRELVAALWGQFQHLGPYEANAIDITDCSADEAAAMVKAAVAAGVMLL